MAVINSPQIGIARGKLGDAVYYRSKGNTNARGYNPNTTNRRTVSQQQQRSLFSSAVKFFARGTQNLFVFAFEDKRTQESDYNAFMRYNAKRGIFFGPSQNENPAYPALGNWIMTHGSLPRIDYKRGTDHFEIELQPAAGFGDIVTVGQLSSLLLTAPEWSVGDIFTIVSIGSDSLVGSPTEPVRVGSNEPYWVIQQFIVDESDSTSLDTLGLEFVSEGIRMYLTYSAEYPIGVVGITAFAAIHSRIVAGQLRVSDSTLIFNSAGNTAIGYGQGQSWMDIVLAAWGSEQPSILQGGIVRRSSATRAPQLVFTTPPPCGVSDLSGEYLIILGSVNYQDVVSHLKLLDEDGVIYDGVFESPRNINFYKGADILLYAQMNSRADGVDLNFNSEYSDNLTIQSIYWD
jgi:hypothetical protein